MNVDCQVCFDDGVEKQIAKYKCPQCLTPFCSVACYKRHKETCLSTTSEVSSDTVSKDTSNGQPEDIQTADQQIEASSQDIIMKEDGELSESDGAWDATEDWVSAELLGRLGESEDLREILENPHLRQMISSLDASETPDIAIKAAMQEPIFVEFANSCLSTIGEGRSKTV